MLRALYLTRCKLFSSAKHFTCTETLKKEAGVLRNPAVSLEISCRSHNTLVFHELIMDDSGIR
jgi:hypothetical protein